MRITAIVMIAEIPLGVAFFIWSFGFDVHPHRIVYACIVALAWVAFSVAVTWLVYWARMKGIRDTYARLEARQSSHHQM